MKKAEIFKYIIVFIVTVGLFATIFYATDRASNNRASEIRIAQDTIAINLLSSETQFDLLNKTDCSAAEGGLFQTDLKSVGDRLNYLESTVGNTDEEVLNLKKYYQLLELKDYLLIEQLGTRCHFTPSTIIYFRSDTCNADCEKEDYVIEGVREQFPDLRIYTIDPDLGLSAVQTLESVNNVPDSYPSLMIDDKVYPGFQSMDAIEKAAPELEKELAAEQAASASSASTAGSATSSH